MRTCERSTTKEEVRRCGCISRHSWSSVYSPCQWQGPTTERSRTIFTLSMSATTEQTGTRKLLVKRCHVWCQEVRHRSGHISPRNIQVSKEDAWLQLSGLKLHTPGVQLSTTTQAQVPMVSLRRFLEAKWPQQELTGSGTLSPSSSGCGTT